MGKYIEAMKVGQAPNSLAVSVQFSPNKQKISLHFN